MAIKFIAWQALSLTKDDTWRDCDVSSYVASGTTGVLLFYTYVTGKYCGFRKNGSSTSLTYYGSSGQLIQVFVKLDNSYIFEYRVPSGVGSVYLIGYTKSADVVLLDTPTNIKTITSGWNDDIDISSYVTGGDTPIAAIIEQVELSTFNEAASCRLTVPTDSSHTEYCSVYSGPQMVVRLEDNKFDFYPSAGQVGWVINLVGYIKNHFEFRSGFHSVGLPKGDDITPTGYSCVDLGSSFENGAYVYINDIGDYIMPDGISGEQHSSVSQYDYSCCRAVNGVIEGCRVSSGDHKFIWVATFKSAGYSESITESFTVSDDSDNGLYADTLVESFTVTEDSDSGLYQDTLVESLTLSDDITEEEISTTSHSYFDLDDIVIDELYMGVSYNESVADSFSFADFITTPYDDIASDSFEFNESAGADLYRTVFGTDKELPKLSVSAEGSRGASLSSDIPYFTVEVLTGAVYDETLPELVIEADITVGKFSHLSSILPVITLEAIGITGKTATTERYLPVLECSGTCFTQPDCNADGIIPAFMIDSFSTNSVISSVLRYIRP